MRFVRARKSLVGIKDCRAYLARTAWRVAVEWKKRAPEISLDDAAEAVLQMRSTGALPEEIMAMQEAVGSDLVFSIERNGVSYNAIRGGFETACDNAGIIYGQTKPGGITWHDLRHTFATRLRGQGVHELDIMHLMGHSSVGVTAGYAHATPSVIQSAVNKLAEPRGEVVQFARRAS